MKILFLDDDEARHLHAGRELMGHEVHHVRTAAAAIEKLSREAYDLALLDHDLGGTHYAPSTPDSGYGVAAAIEEGKVMAPRYVIVHSYNGPGAQRMVAALTSAGVPCSWAPFGPGALRMIPAPMLVVSGGL